MPKKIIKCSNCEEKGIKQNLAEVLPSGMISVQRILRASPGKKYADHTLIGGDKMFIVCGNCGEVAYKKER